MTLTAGSLCAGCEGIGQGLVLAGWPVELAWVAEYDPTPDRTTKLPKPEPQAAQRLLAHRYPEVPNLGDITKVDWAGVPSVDVLTAGFPCQDLSCAGRRAGMGAGTRSGVWAHVVEAIAVLRPSLVVIENVAALLSTEANRSTNAGVGDVEPGPAGLGDGSDGLVLRALGAVLGDLSEVGFDAEWATVSAASVGAPHLRERVFVLAWPADTSGERHRDTWQAIREGMASAAVGGAVRPVGVGGGIDAPLLPTPVAHDTGRSPEGHMAMRIADGHQSVSSLAVAAQLLPTPNASDGQGGVRAVPERRTHGGRGPGAHGTGGPDLRTAVNQLEGRSPLALRPNPRATDGTKGGPNQRGSSGDLMLPSAVMLLPTPTVADSRGSRNATAGRSQDASRDWNDGWSLSDVAYADRWGQYATAIARWEQVLGRPAPEPTEPGTKGQPRLAPRFVEWMQGLPDGWVTAVAGLSRNEQLRILGNGVVPQQCAAAVTHLARIVLAELDAAAVQPDPRR